MRNQLLGWKALASLKPGRFAGSGKNASGRSPVFRKDVLSEGEYQEKSVKMQVKNWNFLSA